MVFVLRCKAATSHVSEKNKKKKRKNKHATTLMSSTRVADMWERQKRNTHSAAMAEHQHSKKKIPMADNTKKKQRYVKKKN